jgi:cytochrome c-type biogenesis protein
MEVSLALAFAAGVVSFVTPCVLALLPVYLAFLGDAATAPVGGGPRVRSGSSVLPQALLFVAGFTALFVILGTSLGLIGTVVLRVNEVRQVAGVLVIGLGLVTMGLFGPVIERVRIPIDAGGLPGGRGLRSVALGALVAIGWTPCIGPVLGAILTMGASTGSAPIAALLLVAYSFGVAVPFLAAAVALPRLRRLLDWLRRHHRGVQLVSGAMVVLIGVLIYTDAFARLSSLFIFVL